MSQSHAQECLRDRERIVGGFGLCDQAVREGNRFVVCAAERQGHSERRAGVSVAVLGVFEHTPGHLRPAFRKAGSDIRTAKGCLAVKWKAIEAPVPDQLLTALAVPNRAVYPANPTTLTRNDIQHREPSMADGLRGFDELFGPDDGLVLLDQSSDECVHGDGSGGIEIAAVGAHRNAVRRLASSALNQS